jgi:hypothetical protein
MTADTVIYARGGGLGHAARGLRIAELALSLGHHPLVLVRPDLDAARLRPPEMLRNCLSSLRLSELMQNCKAETLWVDTFPWGWREEFSPTLLSKFRRRFFLARYCRDLQWKDVQHCYHRIFLPYPETMSEWEEIPVRAAHLGFVLREDSVFYADESRHMVLIDTEERCPASFIDGVRSLAQDTGLSFEYVPAFSHCVRASKFLIVGAGYNTFYETLLKKIDARFLPVEKRYDDQFRRARLWRRGTESFAGIREWLESPALRSAPAVACCTSLKEAYAC